MTALRPIKRLSPTSIEKLLACPLQLAFDHPGSGPTRRTPHQALGDTAHDLSAEVHGGGFDDVTETDLLAALRSRWDELAKQHHDKMLQAWPGAPEPHAWNRHSLVRTQLTRHLARVSAARTSGASPEVIGVETELTDDELELRGRFDRVERSDGGIAVVDLKTGNIDGDEIPASYFRQLLVYAHLWQVNHSQLPTTGAVERPNGQLLITPIDPEAVASLIDDVVRRRDEANALIKASALEQLAAPSANACKWCTHRAWCDPHWKAITPDWEQYGVCFEGTVTSAPEAGSAHNLTIAATAGSILVPEEATLVGVPAAEHPTGRRVRVVDALRTHSPAKYRYGAATQITMLP